MMQIDQPTGYAFQRSSKPKIDLRSIAQDLVHWVSGCWVPDRKCAARVARQSTLCRSRQNCDVNCRLLEGGRSAGTFNNGRIYNDAFS